MTVILIDPFDTTANWTGGTSVAGRTGNGLQIGSGAGTAIYTIPAGPLRTLTQRLKFSYRVNAVGTGNRGVCSFDEGGLSHVTLAVGTAGQLRVTLGTAAGILIAESSTGIIAAGTWYTIDIAVKVANTGGTVNVKLNGTTVIDVTAADTANTTTPVALDKVVLRGSTSGNVNTYDDLESHNTDVTAVTVKVYNGTAFVDAPVKVYNGTAFVDATAVKTWSGSAWV